MSGQQPKGQRPARRRATDQRIEKAVLALIRDDGPEAVTMDTVSERSGVSRTTLYRRYRDRFDLIGRVAESVSPLSGQVLTVDGPLTAAQFERIVQALQDAFTVTVGPAFFAHLLTSDAAFISRWRERIIAPQTTAVQRMFLQGVADGILRPDIDYELIIEYMVGGIVATDTLRGSVPATWAHDTAAMLWSLIAIPVES